MLEPRDAVLEMLRAKGYPEVERSKFGGYEGRCPCKHATRVAVFFNPKGDPGECLMHCKPSVIRKAVGDEPLRNGNGAEGLPFIMGDKAPRPILENILVAMSQIPWEGLIAYDELAVRPMLMGLTPAHIARFPATKYPRPWNDADDAIVASWLQAKWNLFVKPSQIPDAVRAISVQHSYHPARDYLSDLKWDGKPRLDTWLQEFLGVADSQLVRAFGSKFLIGGIARATHGGAKVDHMLILEGPQGSLKSTALETLMPSPELFTDDLGEALGKEAAERIQGKWLVEVAELDAMSKAETTRIKSFITRQVDHYRPAYGRHPADFPRQCVFAGTTNQESYLRDETGGRRFWPVRVGTINVKALAAARDQLWAEAAMRHAAGEPWWLDDCFLVAAAAVEQRERYDEDIWHERIRLFLVGREEVTIAEVLDGLKVDPARQGDAEKKRVGKTLRALGWERGQARRGDGSRPRVFRPSPLSPESHNGVESAEH
jgi:putative DNA primase/helicase